MAPTTKSQIIPEDAERPQGAGEKHAPDYDPVLLPEGHPARVLMEQGKVLFRTDKLNLVLPMAQPRDKREDGHRVRVSEGHVIRFEGGEYWADAATKYKVYRPGNRVAEMTEVEFLRDAANAMPYHEIHEVKPGELSPEGRALTSVQNKIDVLQEMTAAEIRALFEPQEIDKFSLQKAQKNELILRAVRMNKRVPGLRERNEQMKEMH